jgi:flagellar biosynthetic protein FliQ
VTDTAVMEIALQTMMITAKLAAPILITSLAIGVFISLIQSVTQVQEFTLTFVPKLGGIAVVILISGSWMLAEIISFTQDLFASIPTLLGT